MFAPLKPPLGPLPPADPDLGPPPPDHRLPPPPPLQRPDTRLPQTEIPRFLEGAIKTFVDIATHPGHDPIGKIAGAITGALIGDALHEVRKNLGENSPYSFDIPGTHPRK